MKYQSLFSLEIFRGGIILKIPKKIYKLFFQNKNISKNILIFGLKNDPRGKCLLERSYHKKLSYIIFILGDSFILIYKNKNFLVV